ncbi:MAG: hypothetical protein JXR78_19130 [Victivallales bacterium]|nr:hypothetical protein [Victivallales bacterium]
MKYYGLLIFFWMLCYPALVPASAPRVVTDHGTRIIFSQSCKDLFTVRNHIRDIENGVTRMLRLGARSEPGVACTVFMVDDRPEGNLRLVQTRSTLLIYLPADYSLWKDDFEVQRKLVCCFYLIRSGIQVPDMERLDIVPYWLQMGTLEFIWRIRGGGGQNQVRLYPRVRNAELAGIQIGLDDVLSDKITPDRGVMFELYMELCDMLTSRCHSESSARNNLFYEMIVLAANKGIAPGEAFYMTAGRIILSSSRHKRRLQNKDNVSENELVRRWFRDYLRGQVINNFMPLPIHIWKEHYERLLSVEYLTLQDRDATTTVSVSCKLNELDEKWDGVYDKKMLKIALIERFSALERESPALFSPAFAKLYKAVNSLPESDAVGDTATNIPAGVEAPPPESDSLKIALEGIEQVYKRQRDMEDYLEAIAQQHSSPWERYQCEFQIMDIVDEESRRAWPELNNYLDQLEKALKVE